MKRTTILIASAALGALLLPGLATSEMERELQGSGGFFKWHGDRRLKVTHKNDVNNVGFISDQRQTADPVCLYFGTLNVVPDGSKRYLRNVRAFGVGQSDAGQQDFNQQQVPLMQVMVNEISPELALLAPEIEANWDFRYATMNWAIDPVHNGPSSGAFSAYSLGVSYFGRESKNSLTVGTGTVDYGDWHPDDLEVGIDLPGCQMATVQALAPLLTAILPDLLKEMEERPDR